MQTRGLSQDQAITHITGLKTASVFIYEHYGFKGFMRGSVARVLTPSTAICWTSYEFLKKLCERGDINKMESELNKCLLNSSSKDQEERISFIKYFMENFQIFTNDNIKINISPNNPFEADSDIRKINKSELMFGTKSATQNEDFSLKKFTAV